MTDLGAMVREIRDSLGLTQVAFAQALGLTSVSISYIENGKVKPSYETLRRIEERFGVEFEIRARRVKAAVTN